MRRGRKGLRKHRSSPVFFYSSFTPQYFSQIAGEKFAHQYVDSSACVYSFVLRGCAVGKNAMGKTDSVLTAVVTCVLIMACGVADAGIQYTLGVSLSEDELAPGESGRLEVWLRAEEANVASNSALFRVFATDAGLTLTGYDWASPYVTNGDFDWSYPGSSDWPITLDEDTLSGGGYPSDLVDIEFSNAVLSGVFETGPLLWIDFVVPADWSGDGVVFFGALSDTIADGATELNIANGDVATLIIPAPGVLAVLGGALLATRPRSCRRHGSVKAECD